MLAAKHRQAGMLVGGLVYPVAPHCSIEIK